MTFWPAGPVGQTKPSLVTDEQLILTLSPPPFTASIVWICRPTGAWSSSERNCCSPSRRRRDLDRSDVGRRLKTTKKEQLIQRDSFCVFFYYYYYFAFVNHRTENLPIIYPLTCKEGPVWELNHGIKSELQAVRMLGCLCRCRCVNA